MKLTFSPLNAFSMLVASRQRREDAAYNFFVDAVSAAEKLVAIWEQAVQEPDTPTREEKFTQLVSEYPSNAQPYLTLSEYYKYASSILGRHYPAEMNALIFSLGKLLQERISAKEILNELGKSQNSFIVFNDSNDGEHFNDLAASIGVMRREVAALKAQGHMFRHAY